jgi:predicted GNAT family acetyltransferase
MNAADDFSDADPEVTDLDAPSVDADAEIAVDDHPDAGEFRARVADRQVAVMRYSGNDVVTIRSVVVEPGLRGEGIGTAFIAHVLDDLRDSGRQVIAGCSEVRDFLERNPDYADLVYRD